MYKKIIFLPLLLLLVLVLGACSTQTAMKTEDGKNTSQEAFTSDVDDIRRPDFGQPEREADVRGIVTSLVGNEATILEVQMGVGRNRASSTVEDAQSDSNETEKPSVSLTGTTGGAPGMPGQSGGMGPGRYGASQTDRTDMIARLKEMSTGEAKIIIPVGIQMLKSSSNDSGQREMIEASLEDISADKTLTVWLDQSVSDRKVAEFVLIN